MDDVENVDGGELVEQYWPYDGPHAPAQIVSALDAVSALIRYCNNATSDPRALGYAPQAYRAVGGLTEAAGRLPQLAGQLEGWARAAAQDPSLRHDQYRGETDRGAAAAHQAAGTAAERFGEVTAQATLLADTLTAARAELAHLCHDLPDEDPEGWAGE